MTVLVTGATGHLGRLVVRRLLTLGVEPDTIVAGARTPARADDLADLGVRVRRLEYDDPATVRDAMHGVDRVLLVSAGEPGRRVAQHPGGDRRRGRRGRRSARLHQPDAR